MQKRFLWIGLLLLASACQSNKPAQDKRVELQAVGTSTVQIVPKAGQSPYCLVFSVSEKGVVRQLTITETRQSITCKAGEPIGGVTFRFPPEEGKVRIWVIFSDRPLEADPMASQFHDLVSQNPNFQAMDLRAPGTVQIETVEYTPVEGPEPEVVVGSEVTGDNKPASSADAPKK